MWLFDIDTNSYMYLYSIIYITPRKRQLHGISLENKIRPNILMTNCRIKFRIFEKCNFS